MIKDFRNRLKQKYLRIPLILYIILGNLYTSPVIAGEKDDALLKKIEETAFNFHQVTPELYRSGLISKESVPLLKKLGVKTILTFDNRLERVEEEKRFVDSNLSGINFISLPWSGWEAPKDETIREIHQIMDSSEKPVLIHCKHGQERTGVAVATWRIKNQGWTADQAFSEMKAYGFRSFLYGHLKQYVYEFAAKHGERTAKISALEQAKTNVVSFFYQKVKRFIKPH